MVSHRRSKSDDSANRKIPPPKFSPDALAALCETENATDFSPQQEQALEFMRANVAAALDADASLRACEEFMSDLRLLRFLRANSWECKDAWKEYYEALKFRREYKMDKVRDKVVAANRDFFNGGDLLSDIYLHPMSLKAQELQPRMFTVYATAPPRSSPSPQPSSPPSKPSLPCSPPFGHPPSPPPSPPPGGNAPVKRFTVVARRESAVGMGGALRPSADVVAQPSRAAPPPPEQRALAPPLAPIVEAAVEPAPARIPEPPVPEPPVVAAEPPAPAESTPPAPAVTEPPAVAEPPAVGEPPAVAEPRVVAQTPAAKEPPATTEEARALAAPPVTVAPNTTEEKGGELQEGLALLRDRHGNVVIIECPGTVDYAGITEIGASTFTEAYVWHIEMRVLLLDELSRRCGKVLRVCALLDFSGFKMSIATGVGGSKAEKEGYKAWQACSKLVSQAYPDATYKNYVIGTGGGWLLNQLIQSLAPKRSAKKFVLLGDKEDALKRLHEDVDTDNLPQRFGGKLSNGKQWP